MFHKHLDFDLSNILFSFLLLFSWFKFVLHTLKILFKTNLLIDLQPHNDPMYTKEIPQYSLIELCLIIYSLIKHFNLI